MTRDLVIVSGACSAIDGGHGIAAIFERMS